MPTDPAAQAAYRVPRSEVDNYFLRGDPLSESRVGTGVIVSIDSASTCTVLINDEMISGVIWLGSIPPKVGDVVEIEQRGDLLVISASNDIDSMMEDRENDAQHIVSAADPGKPPAQEINVGGSFRDLDAWEFTVTDSVNWTRAISGSGAGITCTQTPAAPDGAVGILWSETSFEVEPGDILDITANFAEIVPTTIVQVVILWGTVEDGDPDPGDTGSTQISYGGGWGDLPEGTLLTEQVIVPITVTGGAPKTARLGFSLTGYGDASLVMLGTTVMRTPKGYPVGSLWMDPDAQRAGLITATASVAPATAGLAVGTPGTWYRANGIKKAVVQAPANVAGVAFVTATGAVQCNSAVALNLRLTALFGAIKSAQTRVLSVSATDVIPFALTALLPITTGGVDEVMLEFTYAGATAQTHTLLNPMLQVVFLPGGVMAGAPPQDASLRWWDGDSWRPPTLDPAAIDVSLDGAGASPARTNTTTTLVRSNATIHEGEVLTLTSTVSVGNAVGSVTFHTATSASGPWTVIGTSPLVSGTATKTYTAVKGVRYFKASYAGDAAYNPSESAVVSTTVQYLTSRTVTMQATKAQAYTGAGDKLTGTGVDRAIHQGMFNGNRKSLLWFTNVVPTTAIVRSAILICKAGGWDYWENAAGGTLVLGSFRNQAAIPTTYPGPSTNEDRSRHAVDRGGWSANITSWADTELVRSDWNGITFGRGPSEAKMYAGYSDVPGEDWFSLKVTYDVWVTPS